MVEAERLFASLKSPILPEHKLFSKYVSLKLLYRFDNWSNEEREVEVADELRMLKAILTLNKEYVIEQELENPWQTSAFNSPEYYRYLWKFAYATIWPFFETNHVNVPGMIITEMVKCNLLNNWLSNEFPDLLQSIEEKLGIKLNEGFLCASKLAFDFVVKENQYFGIFSNPKDILKAIFEAISATNFSKENDHDFTFFKGNPVIKLSEDRFAVRFMPFLIPAFGTGLYFKARVAFEEKHGKNKFREIFTEKFNEQFLVKTILDWCFGKKNQIIDINTLMSSSKKRSDYIVSNHKASFVFEVKDNLIKDELAGSFTAEKVEEKIDELFCKTNGTGLAQLSSTLERLPQGSKKKNRSWFAKHELFPILLVSSSKLNCSGVNLQINDAWENHFLPNMEDQIRRRVHPVTVIHIDSLIYFSDYFNSGNVSLQELLKLYHRQCLNFKLPNHKPMLESEAKLMVLRSAQSFYQFLDAEMRRRGYSKPTKHFIDAGLELGVKVDP